VGRAVAKSQEAQVTFDPGLITRQRRTEPQSPISLCHSPTETLTTRWNAAAAAAAPPLAGDVPSAATPSSPPPSIPFHPLLPRPAPYRPPTSPKTRRREAAPPAATPSWRACSPACACIGSSMRALRRARLNASRVWPAEHLLHAVEAVPATRTRQRTSPALLRCRLPQHATSGSSSSSPRRS
jgi:hypothetical protein